jgi:hypothetical protein
MTTVRDAVPLTLPSLRDGPLPLPAQPGEGFDRALTAPSPRPRGKGWGEGLPGSAR